MIPPSPPPFHLLAGALSARLITAVSESGPDADDLLWFGARVATLAGTPITPVPPSAVLPVLAHWPAALAAAEAGVADLARPLAALAPDLSWTQNPNYRRRPPTPDFLSRYGYAQIAGPEGPIVDAELAMGVLLLAPGTLYPSHRHPAVELYCALDGEAEWWRDGQAWRRQPPGALIHHPSDVPHAMRAGTRPFLALYLWRGDLASAAVLAD